MKTKKQFQDIVGKLKEFLPREHTHLAQKLHRAAGETRQEFAAKTAHVKEMRREQELLKASHEEESKKRHAAEVDAKAKADEIRRLKKDFAKHEKGYAQRCLPYHDSVIDALIEVFHAVAHSTCAVNTIRKLAHPECLKLNADHNMSLDQLTMEDRMKLLVTTTSVARYSSLLFLKDRAEIHSHDTEALASKIYDAVCKYLVQSYLEGNDILPLHPSVVWLVACDVCPNLEGMPTFVKVVN